MLRSIGSATNTQWVQSSNVGVPVGTILPWVGGYFTANNNTGFTSVLGNDAASINARLNPMGYYLCDGSAVPSNLNSPIYNASSRRLPNLTDYRFLSGTNSTTGIPSDAKVQTGSAIPGQVTHEGSNSRQLLSTNLPGHTHYLNITTPSSGDHTHTIKDPGHSHLTPDSKDKTSSDEGGNGSDRMIIGSDTGPSGNRNKQFSSTSEKTGITVNSTNSSHQHQVTGRTFPATDDGTWSSNSSVAYNYPFNNRPAYLLVHFIMKVF